MYKLKYLLFPFFVINDLFKFIVIYLPGSTGKYLRSIYYRRKFKSCGKNLFIDVGVQIEGETLISIGDNVYIDKYCVISTGKRVVGKITKKENNFFEGNSGEIIIGNDIHISQFSVLMGYGGIKIKDRTVLSSGCKIYSLTNIAYDLTDRSKIISLMPYKNAPFLISPVVIEENVWLGLNTIIMPSVRIGKNSFSKSNSLILDNFNENSYLGGQPAENIRKRFQGFSTI